MTTVAVLANPPEEGAVPQSLVDDGVVSEAEAATLYRAMVADVCEAVQSSGAELLVNYRPADQLSVDVEDPEDALRSVVEDELDDTGDIRYEVQVGSTFAARVGNTVTHLLEREEVQTAAAVTPTAAFLGRQHVDSAAMKLRRSEVVLGPTTDGRVYYAGFSEPVDFDGAYDAPAVESLVAAADEATLDADFLPMLPVLESATDLGTALPLLRARADAGLRVPLRTAGVLFDLGFDEPRDR
ncbi:hypothetical protein SAMN05216559_2931 [Halomicrobium zhouii]|uniref:DUF2064 domain-containing protein n=1 Tax=Halomicrobium zhouii TaxID=767519 RepID=A0A1I6LQT9_9EURY|nr:DUF2064 domain-containing protein [Halomicrobium zhouii]SFS05834.1 hypothetical protein SAMN05216559_2931 [Halomicrobium zhouii]